MACPNCISGSLSDGKYICATEDYRVIDSNDSVVFITEIHDIPSDDGEIGDFENVKYCICGYWSNE